MAFVRLLCTASKLKKLKQQLTEEKQDAVKISQKKSPKKRWRHLGIDLRLGFQKCLNKIFSFPEHTRLHRICYNVRHEGSCENFTLKSILGFLSGFLLTYIFFMFFVFQLNFKLSTATIMCSIFGSILTIGLAFSYKIRCIVLLTLPQFFSKKGRQALLAYAFILAITGPAKNTLNNMAILSESLACGQEQLKSAVRQIIEVVKKPFYAIKEAIKKVVKTVKEIVKKIKEILLKIKRIIMAIIKVIKSAFEFIGKILNICNKELGTPFDRCARVFENAIMECNAKLGPMFNWLCSLSYIVKSVCYLVKIFDVVCMVVDFISNSIIGVVIRKVKIFIRHIKTMFYVRIKFSHSFHFVSNSSKTLSEISTGIVAEIKDRSKMIVVIFDFMSSAATIFFVFIIFRVCYYRYKFLTSERFDNKFITKYFFEIDLRRAKLGKETILPLNSREAEKYIRVASKRLVKTEKRQLSKAAATLGTATLKLAAHMAVDYSLFWILNLIRYYAKFQSKVKAPNVPMVFVTGDGILADLLKSIVKAFQPLGVQLDIDTVPCLPTPIPPDYDRYIQIATLLLLCWFLTMLEPYGLRLRNTVMCYYHPTRAKQRAVWLYNQILRSRSSFLKFARRQLRRKVFGSKGITKVTCKEYLRANIKSPCFRICLGSDSQITCLLCGEVFREEDKAKPIYCQTPGCPGVYCDKCFSELQNLCTVCLSPIEYGDMSDISEEKDSSEEEPKKIKPKKKKSIEEKDKKSGDDDDDNGNDGGGFQGNKDSDYFSSDHSSDDYSYTYQDEKNRADQNIQPPAYQFKDVEKQGMPDYATMDHFRADGITEIKSVQKIESSSSNGISNVSKRRASDSVIEILAPRYFASDTSSIFDDSDVDTAPLINKSSYEKPLAASTPYKKPESAKPSGVSRRRFKDIESSSSQSQETKVSNKTKNTTNKPGTRKKQKKTKKKMKAEAQPLLDELTSSSSEVDKKNTPHTRKASFDKILNYEKGSSSPSFSSIDSEIKNTVHYESIVPKLDLSSLINDSNDERNRIKYNNVKFETVSEISSRTSGKSSSSNLSSIIEELISKKERDEQLKTFRKKKERKLNSPGSPLSNDQTRQFHKKKVKEYYQSTSNIWPKTTKIKPENKNKFLKFVQSICPKLKSKHKSNILPLHNEEIIELKSYNYSQDHWDTLSSDTSSLIFPIGTNKSPSNTDTSSSNPTIHQNRIRGGECTNFRLFPELNTTQNLIEATLARSRPCFINSTPLPFVQLKSHEVLSKYFINIEDLTPTRDTNALMTQFGLKSPQREEALDSREPPEKDRSSIVLKESPSRSNIHFINNIQESQSKVIDTEKSASTGSSYLSDNLCISILGRPKTKLKEKRKEKSVTSSEFNVFHSLKGPPLNKTEDLNDQTKPILSHEKSTSVNQLRVKKIPDLEKIRSKTENKNISQPAASTKIINNSNAVLAQNENNLKAVLTENVNISSEVLTDNKNIPQTILNKKQLKNQETNTCDELGNFEKLKSKKLQTTEEQIDYFDRPVSVPKYTNINTSKKRGQQFLRKRSMDQLNKPNQTSRDGYFCYCSPERDNSMYQPCVCCPPAPPLFQDCGRCQRLCKCVGNTDEFYRKNDHSIFNITQRSLYEENQDFQEPKIKDNSTQTYMPHEHIVKCSCHCADTNDCYAQKSRKCKYLLTRPTCDCHSSSSISDDPDYLDGSPYSDLPYQNNDDYLDLVQELEDTLVTRNRNRVRRAMDEFENRSRQNRPLEKPIINYDEPRESEECILEKLTLLRSGKSRRSDKRCTCRHEPRRYECSSEACERMWPNQQQGYVQQIAEKNDDSQSSPGFGPKYPIRTHWQLNPKTGEWFKVNDSCMRRGRRSRTPSPHMHKDGCGYFDRDYYQYKRHNSQN